MVYLVLCVCNMCVCVCMSRVSYVCVCVHRATLEWKAENYVHDLQVS